MATYTNKNGTSAADTLIYDKGGTGVVYHTYAGADKVTIKGGSITVINESGNDIFTITGGSIHNITGCSNNDTLLIDGGNAIAAMLGSGNDKVTIINSDGKNGSALSAIKGGEWTDTFTTEAGAQNYQLYGEAGNDIFNINGGKSLVFWGGAANDTFNVKGGTNIKLRGGDSADIYNISVDKVDMQLGYGNDVVNVTAGNNQVIKGNLGINEINLKAGSGHILTSDIDQAASKKVGHDVGYGVDKVYISGTASGVTANLGDGKDIIEVSSGTGHKLYTEGWGDTIVLSGSTSNSLLDAGAGDDIINISGGTGNTIIAGEGNDTLNISGGSNNIISGGLGNDTYTITKLAKGNKYTIDNATSGGREKDLLQLPENTISEFTWAKSTGKFVLSHKSTGATITVNGWENNPLQKIIFKDSMLLIDSAINGNVSFEVAEEGNVNGKTVVVDGNTVLSGSLVASQTKAGNASGNTVNILSGTINNYDSETEAGGEVVAGKVNGEGQANNNIVNMSGGDITYIRGGRATASGEASYNKTTVTGGKLVAADGGYSKDGKADYNEVTVTGGTFESIEGFSSRILGGRSINGEANNNIVKVSNITSQDLSVYGAQGNSNGTAKTNNNTATVENSTVKLVAGGWASGTGAALENVVSLKNVKVSDTLETAAYVEQFNAANGVVRQAVVGGYSGKGNVNRNEVTIEGGQVSAVYGGVSNIYQGMGKANNNVVTLKGEVEVNYNVYGGYGTSASGNTVNIEGATITGYDKNVGGGDDGIVIAGAASGEGVANNNTINMKAGEVYMLRGGRTVDGVADGNRINMAGGTVDYVEGGRSNYGTASNNIVTINGGEVTYNVRAGRVVGPKMDSQEMPVATGNQAIINGGKVKNVYGGFATNAGNITGNSVEIKDAQVSGNVYGGYTKVGEAKENDVVIGGIAVVEGNVYDSFGSLAATDKGGSITLKDSAEVKGIINGSAGVDTINIEGGKAASIETKAGNDIINVKAGQVASISAGGGADTITITGGSVGTINGGGGNDTIFVTGVDTLTIAGGEGSDTYTFTELKAGQKYIVNNADFVAGDADRLVLAQYNKDDFEYALEDGIAVITHKATGATITINGWEDNALDTVVFLDGEVPGSSLFTTKTLVIDDGETYGDVGFLELDPYEKKPGSGYSVILKNGTVDTITGRYLKQGDVNNNAVVMEGGTLHSSIVGAEADNGDATDNKVDIKGGLFVPAPVLGNIVTGGLSHTGNANNNKVNIVNISADHGNGVDLVTGGLSGLEALEGKANNNKVTLSGNVQAGRIIGGTSINNSAKGNEVILQGNVNVNEVSGGVGGAGEVGDNKITVQGQAKVFTLTAGSLIEGAEGKVENNEVIIGEKADIQWVTAGSASGSEGLIASGNKVKISGEAEVYSVTGASIKDSLYSEVSNNQVIVEGGTIKHNIVGGSNESMGGKALNNSVILSGNAKVLGNVTASIGAFNTETDNMGSVTVNDQAEVKGRIYGDVGIDTITINGGTVNEIITDAGADIIEINGGTVTTLDSDEGDDTIHVTGGNVGLLDAGPGADTIIVEGGHIHTIDGSFGNDTVIIRGGSVDMVTDLKNDLSGDDTIEISGGTVGYVDGAVGNDTITVTGGSVGTVDGSYGNDTINISGVETLTAKGGSGSDIYRFTKLAEKQAFTIDNSGNKGEDADTLDLRDYKFNEFTSTMDNGNLVITHKATNATITINDYDNNALAAAKFQDAILTGEQLKNLDKIMIIDDEEVHKQVIFKQVASGDIDGYQVILNNGEVNGIIAAYTSEGTASNNSVTINGGKVTGQIYAGRGNGSSSKGTITEVNNNSVTITGGIIEKTIYAGYSSNGKATENSVTITGDVLIKGDVYNSSSSKNEATDDMGSITIGGNATIEGIVYGGSGKDVITINGGNFTNTSGGYVVRGRGGDDTIIINAGSIPSIDAGNDNDTVTVKGGIIGDIILGSGNDTFVLDGADARIENLNLVSGKNTITLIQGSVENIKFGSSGDTINLVGVSNMELLTGDGADYINISAGSNLTVQGNYGNDVFTVTGGDHIKLEGGIGEDPGNSPNSYKARGDDSFVINGGSFISADGGYGEDTFEVTGGENITLNGGYSNDAFVISGGDKVTLIGGDGDDTYEFRKLNANASYVIDMSQVAAAEKDVINLDAFDKDAFEITKNGKDVILTNTNGASITLKDWNNVSKVVVSFAGGQKLNREQLTESIMPASANSQADVIKSFMSVLSYTANTGFAALDEAVAYASLGRYANFTELVEDFKESCLGNNSSRVSDIKDYIKNAWGINIDNEDTGAITGADAGGAIVKTKESVVSEDGFSVSDFVYDTSNTITAINMFDTYYTEKEFYAKNVNGLTLYWDESNWDSLELDRPILERVIGAITNVWVNAASNLVEESYGLSLTDESCRLQTLEDGTRGMQVRLVNDNHNSWIAWVSNKQDYKGYVLESLTVNMAYFSELITDVNGNSTPATIYDTQGNPSIITVGYLDRTIAHELVHGAMAANINGFNDLPLFIAEGLAELVHGIDDKRTNSIMGVANPTFKIGELSNEESLNYLFSLDNPQVDIKPDYSYAGGYALLRYFAKEIYDYANGGSSASMVSDSSVMMAREYASLMNAATGFADAGAVDTIADFTLEASDLNKVKITGNC